MASIKEIAKKAGVSVSTVSRALNNYQDVNPKTRENIMNIAAQLNYFPNAIAKSLVKKRSYTIGLFFGDQVNSGFDHPFFLSVISAVREEAGNAGYDLLIFTNVHKERATYTTLCRERGVDGVFLILTGSGKKKNEQLIELQESGIPCVAIDLPLEGSRCSYVESNNFLGAKKAVSHLLELGHQKIAFIGGDEISKASFDRLHGYRAALSEAEIEVEENLVNLGYFSNVKAKEIAQNIITHFQDVTAFFAVSDLMAISVVGFLKDEGYRVPEDYSVIGFDDVKEAESAQLTTVRQHKHKMGIEAIKLLMKTIEVESFNPAPLVIPCDLVLRGSTFAPKAII